MRKKSNDRRQFPCQYSVEEIKERLLKSREAAGIGLYKTQSEMRNKYNSFKDLETV